MGRIHNSFAEANCKRSWFCACKDIVVVGPIHSDSVGCSVELPSFLDECVLQNTQFFRRSQLQAQLALCMQRHCLLDLYLDFCCRWTYTLGFCWVLRRVAFIS